MRVAPSPARTFAIVALALGIALAGCWKEPAIAPSPAPPVAPDAAPLRGPSPEARARAIIEAQIAATELDGEDARDRAVRATFAPDAVVSSSLASNLESTLFDKVQIASLQAGGDADVIWFVATFADVAPEMYRNPASSASWYPSRYTGVAARSRGWKIVAASVIVELVDEVRGSGKLEEPPIPNGTAPTSLSALVLDGPALARALPPTAIVIGTGANDIGRGPSALGAWATRKLVLDPNSREVITPRWATLQANVAMPHGNLGVFALAIPNGDSWTPIFVQYIGR